LRVVRFLYHKDQYYGVYEKDTITSIHGDPFDGIALTDQKFSYDEVKLLAPVMPGKIIAAGLNYISHARELKMELPKEPLVFLKPSSSVLDPFDAIIRPVQSSRVDYEAELAVVIGKKCKNVSPEEAGGYVLGFTCLNDVTARDLQAKESQWTRAKGFDTFCPIGPWVETQYDWRNKRIRAILNGELKQDANTDDFIHPVEKLISYISAVMTLNPGDVVATGTASGIGPMSAGDTIQIEIEGIGILQNTVADQQV